MPLNPPPTRPAQSAAARWGTPSRGSSLSSTATTALCTRLPLALTITAVVAMLGSSLRRPHFLSVRLIEYHRVMVDFESLTCGWCGRKAAITTHPDGRKEIVLHAKSPLDSTTCPGSNIVLPTPGPSFEEHIALEAADWIRYALEIGQPYRFIPGSESEECNHCHAVDTWTEDHDFEHDSSSPGCAVAQVEAYVRYLESLTS